jgi:hypothetical protein
MCRRFLWGTGVPVTRCLKPMTRQELHSLLDPQVQEWILAHRDDDPASFALRFHGRKDIPVRAIAEQIDCIRKARKKLPTLSRHNLLYLPVSLEQASGERAAAYKATFLSGKRAIDLSGGFGIDAIFLSGAFQQVVYCERDPLLAELVSLNLRTLGITNVEIRTGDGLEILESYPDDHFDQIFVDPARRDSARRYVGLEACSPDVVSAHDQLLAKAPKVCIKASPALELSAIPEVLPALDAVVVVSVDRECKETLLMLDRNRTSGQGITLKAVCLTTREEQAEEITVEANEGDVPAKAVADAPGRYLYEPDPAIIKAKLTAKLASELNLHFLNATVDYLTSYDKIEGFPGRTFVIKEVVPYKPKEFKAFLVERQIRAASIQRRDFPLSPEDLRRTFRLKESDDIFLIFTKDSSSRFISIYCRRV